MKQGLPVVEACYAWTWNDFHMTPHQHERAEIMYLLKGRCSVQILRHGQTQEVPLHVGEFIFIDEGIIHALAVDDSCYMINVEFRLSGGLHLLSAEQLARKSEAMRAWLSQPNGFQVGKDPEGKLCGVLNEVVDDFASPNEAEPALTELHLAEMLVQMAKQLLNSSEQSRCLVHVRRCVQLLTERLDEAVRIDALAKEIGVSAAYLQRIFHQVQGTTIVEYLNRLRIERAKLLLANTPDPVIDIAVASGFNSRQHFCRVFAASEGCSPNQYRAKVQKAEAKQVFLFP